MKNAHLRRGFGSTALCERSALFPKKNIGFYRDERDKQDKAFLILSPSSFLSL
jgi:hypothetical protein